MYYTVIKHDGHLRTRGKCRKHEPQASVFYISRVFSNVRSVLSQCNTRLSLLHLLFDIDFTRAKQQNTLLSMLYTQIKHRFLTNQRARRVLAILYAINTILCAINTRRIRKSFTNSSLVLPTSRVVYQPITHRDLWSIA